MFCGTRACVRRAAIAIATTYLNGWPDSAPDGLEQALALGRKAQEKILEIPARLQRITDVALAALTVDDLLRELLTRVRTVVGVDTAAPRVRCTLAGEPVEILGDFVAGCDGFHGVCRHSVPARTFATYEHTYPFAWLGILASVAPSTEELIYAVHERGFALHSMRSPAISRLYLQVGPEEQLAEWPDDMLFRLSSLEPMDCGGELVELVATSPRLAPHFHLPLQHGSNVVLGAMRRPYSAADFRRVVETIHARLPHAAIGTDVIVGFPGESDGQFAATARLLESLPIAYAHVFPYSDRPGTVAATLDSKVDGNVIRNRARVVRDIAASKSREFRRDHVGRAMKALTVDDGASVVTGNYLKVRITNPQPRNSWVTVTIVSADPLAGVTTQNA